jgi:gluconate 2-dehydrogenase subunit 3-like protein
MTTSTTPGADFEITRRDFIGLVAYVAALPAAAEFFPAWLRGAAHQHLERLDAPPEPPLLRDYQPRFFAADDFEALQAFTEILIPTDDTPGARDARCAEFIDFVLAASPGYAPDTERRWRDAMRALREAGFHGADAAGRAALVERMSRPERERGAAHPAYFAYRLIKQQNTFAFYTSRAGMIETLDYRGNRFNASFPACDHPEHHTL